MDPTLKKKLGIFTFIIIILIVIIIIFHNKTNLKNEQDTNQTIIKQENISNSALDNNGIILKEIRSEIERKCEAIKNEDINLCYNLSILGDDSDIGKYNDSDKKNNDRCTNSIYLKKMIFENKNYCNNIIYDGYDWPSLDICNSFFEKYNINEDASLFFNIPIKNKNPEDCDKFSSINRIKDMYYCKNILDQNIDCKQFAIESGILTT